MSRLGVVVNPVAGAGRARRTGAAVLGELRRRGHHVRELTVPAPAPAAAPAPMGGASAGPVPRTDALTDLTDLDAVVAVGGDGTLHACAQLTAGTGMPLGVVPAGTGNDVAASLGVRRTAPADTVARLEAALARGPRPVDAVRAGPPDAAGAPGASGARWYLGVLSCGFDAAVSARAQAMTWPAGPGKYLRAVAAELRGFAPYGYRLTLDDDDWWSAGTLVAVANAPRFGGGIAIAPDASMDDGLLDVVVAGPVGRRGVVAVLPGAYRGRHLRHPAVQVLRTRTVLVEADLSLGGPPPVAFADGERLGPLPLRVEVRPGAVAVLA